jgi:hypothetical protein
LFAIYDKTFDQESEYEEDDEDERLLEMAEKIMAEIEERPADTEEKNTKKFMKLQTVVDQLFDDEDGELQGLQIEGTQMLLEDPDTSKLKWMHAPPKLDVPPKTIKENILPEYVGSLFREETTTTSVTEGTTLEPGTSMGRSAEDEEFLQQLLTREHHSAMELRGDEDEQPSSDDEGEDLLGSSLDDGRFHTLLDMRRTLIKSHKTARGVEKVSDIVRSNSQPDLAKSDHPVSAVSDSYETAMEDVQRDVDEITAIVRLQQEESAEKTQKVEKQVSRSKKQKTITKKSHAKKCISKELAQQVYRELTIPLPIKISRRHSITTTHKNIDQTEKSLPPSTLSNFQLRKVVSEPDIPSAAFDRFIGWEF